MIPAVVLVGRPNVGKSTLFNRLTRSRDAIVSDIPGLTRDRHYGRGRMGANAFLVVDTGGLASAEKSGIVHETARQTMQAVDEADEVVFLVDARAGVTGEDKTIAQRLRASGRRIWLVVNKAEGMRPEVVTAEFHELGMGTPYAISAAHGDGVAELIDLVLSDHPFTEDSGKPAKQPCIAVVGRPNAGKSTLVNCLLGEERVIVFDQPGTTRDSIYVDFERNGRSYTLIDTAGLRKRGRIDSIAEKFSVVKTLQSIADANVVVLVIDARQEISDQDTHIAGFILEAGRAVVLAVNKWDAADADQRELIKRQLARQFNFLEFAETHYISALKATGIAALMRSVDAAFAAAMAKLSTPKLTRSVQQAVMQQQPPRTGLTRPKLRYAHQGGSNPPRVVVHGNSLDKVPASYWRYLERYLARAFKLRGTPLKVEYKSGGNPYHTRRKTAGAR